MTNNQPRSFGHRLWWIIRMTLLIFIVLGLVVAVLGGLGYAGYLGVKEIQRADNSLLTRIEIHERNLNSLREQVDAELAEGNSEQQQINQLENDVEALVRQLEALQTARAEDTAAQTGQIDALDANLATAVAQNSDLAAELETVQAALTALQGDLNRAGGRIDELGGDLDTLRLRLGDLDESLANLTTEMTAAGTSEATELQQSVVQLQLWGVLTNARLSLVDGDVAAAETAVNQAITLANSLTAAPDSAATQILTRLQTRLSLAAEGFATDLNMVAQDLDAASKELALLVVSPVLEAELAEGTATPTAVDAAETPAGTTEATATPSPTMPPSPTPTPTSTTSP